MFTRKEFYFGLILGLIIMAITSVIIGWTIAQNTKPTFLEEMPKKTVPITQETPMKVEESTIGSTPIQTTDLEKKAKLLGIKVQGEMSLTPTLIFSFSDEVDSLLDTSTNELFQFSPKITGSFEWANPSTLLYQVEEPLKLQTSYTVFLKEEIFETMEIEVFGRNKLRFTTPKRKPALLSKLTPSEEVDPKANLIFTFSEDVADLQQIGENFQSEFIQFEPPVFGSYRWMNLRQLRFFPESPFKPATHYRVTIKPGLLSGQVFYLSEDQVVDFDTAKFEVISSKMQIVNSSASTSELTAKLAFNYPVHPEELNKYLSLSLLDGQLERPLDYQIKESNPSRLFHLSVPNLKQLKKPREVRLTITKGLICEDGMVGLEKDYISTATVSALDPLKVYHVHGNCNYTLGTITLEFSRAVEAESAPAFLTVEPEVTYKMEIYNDIVRLKSADFQPEEIYTITVNQGLPAKNSAPLEKTFQRKIRMPSLAPLVRFNSPGQYLSTKGNLTLGLETVNLDQLDVSIYKVYANNLVHYFTQDVQWKRKQQLSNFGSLIKNFTLDLKNQQNQLISTPLSLEEYFERDPQGIYQVVVSAHNDHWLRSSKMVIATDIGIVSKLAQDQLTVWVNSLQTLDALYQAKVSLISSNNQVLATGMTNRQGLVKFDQLSKVFAEFDPFLILVEYGEDLSFLKLSDAQLDNTDFPTAGRSYLTDGYEAYLYTDRGVYRPGDQAQITALVRGVDVAIPSELPVRLKVTDPTGRIYAEYVKNTGQIGASEFELALPDYVKTGKYTADLYVADKTIGTVNFNVEEFMPDRIKVAVETDQRAYQLGELAEIKVSGINLYGPPAAGRDLQLAVKLETASFTAPAYRSYSFGDSSIKFKTLNQTVGNAKLDEHGQHTFSYSFPQDLQPGNLLKAVFSATVREEGGRAVTKYQVVDFHPYQSYIGLKRLGDHYGQIDQPYGIQYVEVDQDGQPVAGSTLIAKVYRIVWHSLWQKNSSGRWDYDSEEEAEEILTAELTPGLGEQIFNFTPREYGKYKIVISNPETKAQSSLFFYATGWGYSPWAMSNPTKIELDLDKPSYQPGELAQIQVKAPFSGKALVTIEREKVYDTQIVEFKENTGLLTVQIQKDWQPNVYITVQLIRSTASAEKHAPLRAYGTTTLSIDSLEKKLAVEIKAPAELKPQQSVEIAIEVDGVSDQAYLTLAAVDEGILQLTNFSTPDPYNFFYGKKKLDVHSYDLYDLILPEVERIVGQSTPAGDADGYAEKIRKENLNPISIRRVKPVSLWSGLVKIDASGQATIKLDLPQFNGSLRLMAVAFDGDRLGSAHKRVIIRDPIVLTSTYPRFISGTDKFEIPVAVFNGTGQQGEFTVKMNTQGPVKLLSPGEQSLTLENEEEQLVTFQLEAGNALGKVTFNLKAQGNGCQSSEETELPLRPAAPLVKELFVGTITPDQAIELNLPTEWVTGTEEYSLTISPFPAIQFSESLQYLLKYPYGCAEQTTSRVFPLLYFDQLAKEVDPELFKEGSAAYLIEEGILKLQRMQLFTGGFAYWPGGNKANRWTSIYVSHFLVEARQAGYPVSNQVYDKMLINLKAIARKKAADHWELQNKVYALYVLTLAGQPDLSNLAYIKNHQWKELAEDSRVMLAAAYHYAGERDQGEKLIPFSFSTAQIERETGQNFNSTIRSDAIILSLLADIAPDHPAIPSLVEKLTKAQSNSRWGTTQENAFAYMAIGKLLKTQSSDSYTGQVLISGESVGLFSDLEGVEITDARLAEGKVTLNLSGQGKAYYFAEAQGVPLNSEELAYNRGVTVTREYLDKDGQRLDMDQIKQGSLVIGKITVTGQRNNLNNLVVVDLLPAGLEIENPRLQSRGNIDWLTDESYPIDYLDIRDDRLLLFTNISSANQPVTFYYALRAVTVGEFVLPPIKAECMYEPEISSISATGMLRIVK